MVKQALTPEILTQTQLWIENAAATEPNDPTAACISTIGTDGFPDGRMVLVRIIDENGFVFFTNHNSKKGRDLLSTPRASLCFHWKTQRKQIRIQGSIIPATAQESDDYYNGRARESRIGAWASDQSHILPNRDELVARYRHYESEFKDNEILPRPPHWGGFRLIPHRVEFWQDGDHRLHDRDVYIFENDKWNKIKLYP
jgi:pyridoxamine 5'-phosphate oxidase